jgi:hypothetical protein
VTHELDHTKHQSVINHIWHNQNAVIVERTTQQVIEVVKLLNLSKNLRDNKNKPKHQMKTNKIVRVVPRNEPQTTQTYKKTYRQVVSNNASEAEHTPSMENILAQILQILNN